jgi:hypothetical protein
MLSRHYRRVGEKESMLPHLLARIPKVLLVLGKGSLFDVLAR